jgi:hypothetical protein
LGSKFNDLPPEPPKGILKDEKQIDEWVFAVLLVYTEENWSLACFTVWNGRNGNVFYAALVGRAVASCAEFGIRAAHLVYGKNSLKELLLKTGKLGRNCHSQRVIR